MKHSFAWMLVLISFAFSCCKNKNECTRTCRCDYVTLSFSLADRDNTKSGYFDTHPDLNTENVTMYDEAGNYATFRGFSWGRLKELSFLSSSIELDFHSEKESFGIDRKKTFYLHLDKDIDTIRVEYKAKNECLQIDYIKAFYNDKLFLATGFENYSVITGNIVYK